MITFFTVPKPFSGLFQIIQENALLSWKQLKPECEIIVIGDDFGCAEICERLDLIHIGSVKKNKFGTPLVNDIFNMAEKHASNDLMCYINTDIILFRNFSEIVNQIPKKDSLIIGKRWDITIDEIIDYSSNNWELQLKEQISKKGQQHSHTGVDYFIYLKGFYHDMPPFAIGRTTYDNWFIWKARAARKKVIDASEAITCIHQNHDRTYSSMGYNKVNGNDELLKGVEKEENQKLAGGWWRTYTLLDSTHFFTGTKLKTNYSSQRFQRIVEINFIYPLIRLYQRILKILNI